MDMPPGGMATAQSGEERCGQVNGREGWSSSCHMTPALIWVTGVRKTNSFIGLLSVTTQRFETDKHKKVDIVLCSLF